MSANYGPRAKLSSLPQKLAWLRVHRELWEKARLTKDGRFVDSSYHRRIAKALKDAGLLSKSTYALDARVTEYVAILQAEAVTN